MEEQQDFLGAFRVQEKEGKRDVTHDYFVHVTLPESKKPFMFDVTNGSEAWSIAWNMKELDVFLKGNFGGSWEQFDQSIRTVFAAGTASGTLEFHVKRLPKHAAEVSWQRSFEEQKHVSLPLAKVNNASETIRRLLELSFDRVSAAARKKEQLTRRMKEKTDEFDSVRKETRKITTERQTEIVKMLSMAKALLDSKLDYAKQLEEGGTSSAAVQKPAEVKTTTPRKRRKV